MADRAAWEPNPTSPPRARRPPDLSQARRIRPDSRPTDIRRLVAATLSSVLPGAGQAINGRLRPALLFGVPTLIILLGVWLIGNSDRPAMVLARLIAPSILGALLVVNVVVLVWRGVAAFHAFTDRRYPGRPGRLGAVGLVALLVFTVAPHLFVWSAGTAAQSMFAQIFADSNVSAVSAALPQDHERLNVLLIGVDSGPGRTEALTDSLIVVSLDPVGRTVSMVSIPRDLAGIPLGDGNTYGPKINSLMSYADRHPKLFPDGGIRTLEKAVGGAARDPDPRLREGRPGGVRRDGRRRRRGRHQREEATRRPELPRASTASAAGRSSPASTTSPAPTPSPTPGSGRPSARRDLTRAARQQEVLVALRNRVVGAGVLVQPAEPARRGRRRRSGPTCRRTACRSSRPSPSRSAGRRP